MENFSRTLFIDSIIPRFIRSKYPIFVSFIKEYYKYLDRRSGQLIGVKIINPGQKYSNNPTLSIQIIDTNPQSSTFGLYIPDFKGATVESFVDSGRLEKIRVTNYGEGYTEEDSPRIIISDSTGSGCETQVILSNEIGNISSAVSGISKVRDLDTEYQIFLEFLKNEYIPNLPTNLFSSPEASVEASKFIKFIKTFYNATGVEDSIRFLYRILFNVDVNFYYPKVDMLRISDGRWQIDNNLRVAGGVISDSLKGNRILILGATGATNTTAIVEDFVFNGATGPHWILKLSTINGSISNTPGSMVLEYPITGATGFVGITYLDGATGVFYQSNGRYIGDDGQLSSTKRIQDSFYYQDFSYELQSEESIRSFKGLLEEIIHPAGLIYFIRLNLEKSIDSDSRVDNFTDIFTGADFYLDTELDPEAKGLGPIYLDIDKSKSSNYPQHWVDFVGFKTVSPSTSYSTIDISDSTGWISNVDEFNDWSIIIDEGSTQHYRIINSYNPTTGVITLDSSFTTGGSTTSINYRIIQNYRFEWVTSTEFGLSPRDPRRRIPFTPTEIGTLVVGATGLLSAKSFVVESNGNFNVREDDILEIGSERILVTDILGASGFYNITADRAQQSTSVQDHNPGAVVYNRTDKRFLGWRTYVTSGPGAGSYAKISSYNGSGATGAVGISQTVGFGGASGPTVNSTYYLLPDFPNREDIVSYNVDFSTYSLLYTTNLGAYEGGVLAPNGDIHFVPFNGNRGQKVNSITGVVSTYSLLYTASGAYSGGGIGSSGMIHFAPSSANRGQMVNANTGVVSTYSLLFTGFVAYAGGVVDGNGDLHFVPHGASVGQKVNLNSGLVSTYALVYTVSGAYRGGVLAPNGDVHFAPSAAAVGQKVSSTGVVSTYALVYTQPASGGAHSGGVVDANGDIHFVPHTANRGQKVDGTTGVVSTYSLILTSGSNLYSGGVLDPNNEIQFIPQSASRGQKLDVNGAPSTYTLPFTTSNSYFGGVLGQDNAIYFVPRGANRGTKISYDPVFSIVSNPNDGYFTTGATGITGITITSSGEGYTQGSTGVYAAVVIDPPPYGAPARAIAQVGATGAITGITVINPGTNYLFSPTVKIIQIGATAPTKTAFAYADILNTNSPVTQISEYGKTRGIILSVPDTNNKFITAGAISNLDNITRTTVASTTVVDPGAGYTRPPRVFFRKGGTADNASAIAIVSPTGGISSIQMTGLGSGYVIEPVVDIEPPGFFIGDKIYQTSTGARGIIEKWDPELDLVWILKEETSPDFDLSDIQYFSINISVDSIYGYYDTTGKQIDWLAESEITVM